MELSLKISAALPSLKKVLERLYHAFPYIYFSFLCILMFLDYFFYTQRNGSEFLMLLAASVFIIQLKYKFRYADTVLGLSALFCSAWIFLAVYSDVINVEHWTWTLRRSGIIALVLLNFICSVSLLIAKPRVH